MASRPRQSIRKSPSTPPQPSHSAWAHSPASYSNPTLVQHSGYPVGHARPQQPRYSSDRYSALSKRPMHTPDYSPNYPSSPASLTVEGASGSSTPKTALKMLSSVKRSFSINNSKKSGPSASFTTSTAEETAAAQIRIAESASSKPPPTVQEIAAGLVTGLRPTRPSASRRTTFPRPAPPARSSLKKSMMSNTSSSSSTSLASTGLMSTRSGSTSTAATSVASSRRPRFSLKDALFGRSASAIPTPITTVTRKAVRFHVDRSPVVEQTPLPS